MPTSSGENRRSSTQELDWDVREVLRDIEQRPHLFTRITLSGTYFPQRALEPFVAVGRARSRFVDISEEGLSARAYFDTPLPKTGRIRFGYGNQIMLRFPRSFSRDDVQRLDPARLPENVRLLRER
jgi:hypothetical protein